MSEKSFLDVIRHYQKDIERCPDNAERMMRCLKRLYILPIKVEHLQQTGVGRSVNNLREHPGEVGDAATALVAKWKAMVTAQDLGHDEESPAEQDEDEIPLDKSHSIDRVSPENDRSVKDKENIRLNHRTDKVKNSSEKVHKSEGSTKHSDKNLKDSKSSKHSSKERESCSKKDSSSKNHSSSKETSRDKSKDKKDKEKTTDKPKESGKSDHRSTSEKDKKHKCDKDKHHSKDKEKHSSKDSEKHSSRDSEKHSSRDREKHSSRESEKHSSRDRDKHSSRESEKHSSRDRDKHSSRDSEKHSSRDREKAKDKLVKHSSSSSKDKTRDKISHDKDSSKKDKSSDRSKDRSKDHKERNSDKDKKRSRSHEREKESRKCEKRKHADKERDKQFSKRIKQEKSSSEDEEEEEDDSGSNDIRNSDSDNEDVHSSNPEDSEQSDDDRSDDSGSGGEVSDDEPYMKVKIKEEPRSDSESDKESRSKKTSSHRTHKSSSSSHSKSNTDSKSSKTDNLKALIKENEKKVKKEKPDDSVKSDQIKKSKVKIEVNKDGSIDSGSGASFADALMGFDKAVSPKKKKKKEEKSKESGSKSSQVEAGSSSWRQSPTSSLSSSTPSPAKKHRTTHDFDKELQAPAALLNKPVKLEPLTFDISSTLPEISTNYKPLPNIQSRHTPTQSMSEEQMFSIMTSKNQRTKVYSGYKYGQTMSVPSLYTLCIQVLYENIDGLEFTGGVPFEILKPLLIKLNAEQLLSLEHFNPYLIVDTDDLWKFHCKKTFPKGQRDDMETWREVYLRCMDARELKLKQLTANITESMAIKGPARQAKLAYVDSVAKPPRSIARKQARFGTGSGSSASSPVASTSSSNISQIAAAQNQAKKKEIVSKAVVGAFTPAAQATEQVPAYNNPATAAKMLKKKKAPLMAKALQLIKGTNRFKR